MGTDAPESMGFKVNPGNNVYISLHPDTRAETKRLFDALSAGGVFVTYCAKGQLKRDLKALGLSVETLPGPPGKKEMTRALKR